MAITYTWSVANTERNLSDGGITVIHWRCTGVDGDYSASSYGTTGHTPDADADDFIAYDTDAGTPTQAQCISWAQAQLDQAAIEQGIADRINAEKTPTTAAGVPW